MSLLPTLAQLPYGLLRPLLFGLDAETAHDLTLRSLTLAQHTPLQLAWRAARVDDPVQVAGLRFPNRVGLAAGLDKNACCIDALAALGFGFVEVGTVTPRPQAGNPKPRLFRLPQAQALINRMGFNNDGLATFVRNVQQSRRRPETCLLGLNIGKNADTPIERASDDYLLGLDGVYPYADYVAVNISSPNTKNLRALQVDTALDVLLEALMTRRAELQQQHQRRVPLFVKIAPDLEAHQVRTIAATLKHHGTDRDGAPSQELGVIATNTTLSRDAVAGLADAEQVGGLSGQPLQAASLRVIRQLRTELGDGFPIIGVGGILSASDALAKIDAGADLVQLYTGLIYRGPALVTQVAQALAAAQAVAS